MDMDKDTIIKLMTDTLLMIEWGSLADKRCPDCRSVPPEDGAVLPETSPGVIGSLTKREHYITPTGHYADVECSVDLALKAGGYDTRSKRDIARLKLISGGQ